MSTQESEKKSGVGSSLLNRLKYGTTFMTGSHIAPSSGHAHGAGCGCGHSHDDEDEE